MIPTIPKVQTATDMGINSAWESIREITSTLQPNLSGTEKGNN
jgi:hypothetical protein